MTRQNSPGDHLHAIQMREALESAVDGNLTAARYVLEHMSPRRRRRFAETAAAIIETINTIDCTCVSPGLTGTPDDDGVLVWDRDCKACGLDLVHRADEVLDAIDMRGPQRLGDVERGML
ncbi:hypothetical protein GCM10009555_017770 [Acrocarpospora macrocephala]|uniref:Uncharacterized protein n=1 Tax=Acrocarpospora macrocephala TaxID=150177 RepID=A0A5M3WEE3_9ACTN|nr:hypothetical protein [Acrocarpospora macrocephala]GES07437.1 hypothetical protein Amac_010320 [Acrocarpospora macrocephala]